MANERQSGQQGEQRPTHTSQQGGSGDAPERSGGRQTSGTDLQRSQQGEYQRRGSGLPSAYSGFDEGPFAMMRRLSDEMERMFEGFGMGRGLFPSFGRGLSAGEAGGGAQAGGLWSPRVEVFERGNKLVVAAELPGVDRNDVDVDVDHDGITIQGERRQESTTSERGVYRSERVYGRFYRHIPLPEGVNPDTAQATFRDGVLEVDLDMPQQQRGRRLEIKEGGTAASGTSSGGAASSETSKSSTTKGGTSTH